MHDMNLEADVVTISRESYKRFQALVADQDFLRLVLQGGFSIKYIPDGQVEVCYIANAPGQHVSSTDTDLTEALYCLFQENRKIGSSALRQLVTERRQGECPHDQGTYIRDNPLMPQCNRCHAVV